MSSPMARRNLQTECVNTLSVAKYQGRCGGISRERRSPKNITEQGHGSNATAGGTETPGVQVTAASASSMRGKLESQVLASTSSENNQALALLSGLSPLGTRQGQKT